MAEKWYNKPVPEVIKGLGAIEDGGLPTAEAGKRLDKYGRNVLEREKRFDVLGLLVRQFTSLLVVILIFASAVSFIIGHELDAYAIFGIVIINALLGFFQEFKAEKAMEALRKMTAQEAEVFRDGGLRKIDAQYVVPGDIVAVEAGSKVPADLRIIEAYALRVDQASLTGESEPVEKITDCLRGEKTIAEQNNMLFANTVVVGGRARGVVVGTGMETEFGKIAGILKEFEREETPLKRRLDVLAKDITKFTLVLLALLFLIGVVAQQDLFYMFETVVALGVSAVPEGLPAVITITLALGMNQMAKNNAIVRKMPAVETLGSATVICTDKTGTITKNEMSVERVYFGGKVAEVTGAGYAPIGEIRIDGIRVKAAEISGLNKVLEIGLNCNDAVLGKTDGHWEIIGDPTEGALVVAAEKAEVKAKHKKTWEIPFSSERKMMSTVHPASAEFEVVYTKGALEKILEVCDKIQDGNKVGKLDLVRRKEVLEAGERLGAEAYRVLGFSYKEVKEGERKGLESSMVFAGFVAMRDPPRAGVNEAINACKTAGIRVIMITGDNPLTASAIAERVGMGEDIKTYTGKELDLMGEREFKKAVEEAGVFARVDPEHKLRIVEVLKDKGEIVAVTGDGVNDAPALKKANIGIAMGIKGTDVAKGASDIVLNDDNFVTIVGAIEEGRRIYSNIRNFVKYLLSVNFSELGVIGATTLAGLPLPMLALQILWINIATDSLPALALGRERAEKGTMQEKPRNPKEGILHNLKGFLLTATVLAIIVTFVAYFAGLSWDYANGVDVWDLASNSKARTLAFSSSIMFELFFVFSCRGKRGVFHTNLFSNKSMLAAVFASFLLLAAVIYIPVLQDIFRTVALDGFDWLLLLGLALTSTTVPYVVEWIHKFRKR